MVLRAKFGVGGTNGVAVHRSHTHTHTHIHTYIRLTNICKILLWMFLVFCNKIGETFLLTRDS
mgnify:CR=1 FL=1